MVPKLASIAASVPTNVKLLVNEDCKYRLMSGRWTLKRGKQIFIAFGGVQEDTHVITCKLK